MSCIISREPKVAPPKDRNRFGFRYYELARVKVPANVAEFIESHRRELLERDAHKVYEQLKEQARYAPNYEECQRLQYLIDFFFALSTETPIYLKRVGEEECVPTDLLEHENSAFGYEKVQPCVVLSVRVQVTYWQRQQVKQMIDIVEKKMRSFKTDFYLHDMMKFARVLGRRPLLWIVGRSHTFNELLDSERNAEAYTAEGMDEYRDHYLREDDTWMGSALRVCCGKDDEYYYHDGAVLHKVSRERFKVIHDRYVESVRQKIREKMNTKAA